MDAFLLSVFAIAFTLIMLGLLIHPAFGICGFAVMVLGGIWATS